MGITDFGEKFILKHAQGCKSVLELGSQNTYFNRLPSNPFASEYYLSSGFTKYVCVDMCGDNNALKLDLSKPQNLKETFDLVTDYGTTEHVGNPHSFDWECVYNCWKFKYDHLKVGGILISQNPKTGNWPKHGCNYFTEAFYTRLASLTNLEILEVGENAACNNVTDGWEIYCVMRKTSQSTWIDLETFKTLDLRKS